MRRNTKIRAAALTAAALMLSGAVGFAPSAGAVDPVLPPPFTQFVKKGFLAIETTQGPAAAVVWYGEDGVVVDREALVVNSACTVTSPGRLLRITSSTSRGVGLVNGGLGTKTKANCSTGEGRFGPASTDTITVTLGTAFGTTYSIDSTELDIEGKFAGTVGWLTAGGTTPLTGTSALNSSSSDNGPDSGTSDNSKVVIGAAGNSSDNFRVWLS